jgi:hypothetical protein
MKGMIFPKRDLSIRVWARMLGIHFHRKAGFLQKKIPLVLGINLSPLARSIRGIRTLAHAPWRGANAPFSCPFHPVLSIISRNVESAQRAGVLEDCRKS